MRRLLWIVLLCSSMVAAQTAAQPQFFHITPVRPVEELRQQALKAQPPLERTKLEWPDLVELVKLDATIKLDIRYATSRNFLSTPVYDEARAFMQRPAAEALVRANQKLHDKGFGLLIHDAYRPWYVTKIFWDATPPDKHNFVADPSKGSIHNRGCAVDLTLYDLKTGEAVAMPGLYDEMSERSYPTYQGGTEVERRNRETLREAMEGEGFKVYEFEWWHFNYKDAESFPVLNLKFSDVPLKQKGSPRITKPPHALGVADATYSDLARRKKIIGTVTSIIFVGADGLVKQAIPFRFTGYSRDPEVQVDPANPSADLDIATRDALLKWKFEPAMTDSGPVPAQLSTEMNFKLY